MAERLRVLLSACRRRGDRDNEAISIHLWLKGALSGVGERESDSLIISGALRASESMLEE